ncbi:hypothetical protein KEM55_001910 [Ascosphaera atra]|nr:hypothetical protein KEM55_001910 [Ascosphaera atra]
MSAPSKAPAEQTQGSSPSTTQPNTASSTAERIQSSATNLLRSAFNTTPNGTGAPHSLTSELSRGLANLQGEKGNNASTSASTSASRAAETAATSSSSQNAATGSMGPQGSQSERFREHQPAAASTADAEMSGFVEASGVPRATAAAGTATTTATQDGTWENTWEVHAKGKGKSGVDDRRESQIPSEEVYDFLVGLNDAFAQESFGNDVEAFGRELYRQYRLGQPLTDLDVHPELKLDAIHDYAEQAIADEEEEDYSKLFADYFAADTLEEAWRKEYSAARNAMPLIDGDLEPEYDLEKIAETLAESALSESRAQLSEEDGKDVFHLLNNPSFEPMGSLDDMDDDDETSADEDGIFSEAGGYRDTPRSSFNTTTSENAVPDKKSLLPDIDSLISYAEEAVATGPPGQKESWKAMPSVSEWLDLDSKYIDEVWGGALKPFTEAARDEVAERKEMGLEGMGNGPAVRRLGMVLDHLRGAGALGGLGGKAARPAAESNLKVPAA